MASKNAGEARIAIVPDASAFLKRLEADLKAKRYEYKLPVDADTSPAERDIERLRQEQKRKPFGVDVKADTEQARAEIAALREREQRKALRLKIEFDESNLAEKLKRKLEGIDFSGLGSGLKLNLGAVAVGQLPALATAITSVAGAIQQLSGAGLVLPGVLAGIGADVGVVKLGVMGLGDAFKALDKASDGKAKNIDAANEALAKLAPNAAEAVKTLYGLKPAFDDLQKLDANNLFAGASGAIKTLVDADLPILRRGVDGISKALNQNLLQLGTSLSSSSSQGLLDRILGNTGDAQARLTQAIDPIIHAFGTLAATGTDALPRLADGVGKLADRFDHFITSADDSGKLKKWIDDGITGFDHLGNTLLNIGKSFTAVTKAAGGGGGLLQMLDSATGKLSTFLNSAQGQDTLKKFFADGREELAQLLPIVENLGPILQGMFRAAHDATALWLPLIKEATDVLAKDPDLVRLIADAFLAWKFVPIITGVTNALALIGPSASTAAAEVEAAAGRSSGALEGVSRKMQLLKQGSLLAGGALVLGGVTDQVQNGGPDVGGAAATIGGAALVGFGVGGPWGAAAGALIGAAGEMVATIKQGMDEQTAKFNEQWDRRHNETDPKAIERDNALSQQQLDPLLRQPSASKDLAAKIAAGQLPGYTLGPGGSVIGPNGQPVSGLNVTPPPPPAPPPPPKPVPVSTVQGVPVPFNVPPPTVTASKPATAQQQQQVAANPITAGTTIAATVDPKAQASVDNLAKSITTLPEGKVVIQDASPAVLDNLAKLDTKITTLPEGKVEVTANTEEAKTKLDALIRDYQNQIITIKLNPQTIGVPIAPGHASGGILPGYSPGKDNMLVPLAGGEGIVRPEAVRKYGPGVIHALNRGFDTGGIVPNDPTGGALFHDEGPQYYGKAFAHNSPFAKPGANGYQTALSAQGEKQFRDWVVTNKVPFDPNERVSDYDMRGYWLAMKLGSVPPWAGGATHFPDTFKTPYDTTFSAESQYALPGTPFKWQGDNLVDTRNGQLVFGQGFATGGIVPHLGTGALPGPADGEGSGLGGSFLSGLFGGVPGIGGLLGGNSGGTGGGLTPGLAGLFQAGSNPDLLDQWGSQTGDWLGKFASKTLLSFGTTLWQGALGLVGLQDSILSPSNPYFQDATKAGGFFLGQSGPFGGQGASGTKSKGATEKQLREGQQKIGRADEKVSLIQQRISELPPDAKESQKQSLANQLANAQQDAQDARTDFSALQSGSSGSSVPSGLSGNQAVVYQSMLDAGYPASEWGPLKNLLDKESGFDPTARNQKSGAFGMFQFLGHQGDKYGALGGYSTDPAKQAVAGLAYIKDRYGSPSAAWAQYYSHPGGVGWYAQGGGVDTVPAMLTPGEHVLTTSDVAAMGGQDGVYRFRNALHMKIGGEVIPLGYLPQPPRPTFDVPDVKPITRRPASTVPARPTTAPPSVSIPPPSEPPAPPEPPRQAPPVGGPAPVGTSDGSVKSHTLPAISKGITSGFATAGSLAQTAASLGSFGAAGAAGGIGAGIGGGGGPSISGLFQQFGKIANDIVDVGSAFLVGNVTGGTSPNGQYGDTLRPAQNVPVTAPLNQQRTYNMYGIDGRNVVDGLRLQDQQDSQAALAGYRG